MTDLAKYVVSLETETKRYVDKLDQANKKLDRFERNQRKKLDLIKKGVIALGAAFSVRAVTSFVRDQVRAADSLLKTTQRIGGTVEALSELEHVANLSGVQFNTLTMGLQRMTRRVAEAAQGTGEAVKALKELNLDAGGIAQLSLDQQFEIIAEALSGVANQSDKTRLAMKLFDSEGVALLQTMTRGAAGIREMREEAQRLGKTLSTDQAEAAQAANDAMTRLSASVGSLARNLSLELAPALADAADGLNDLLFPSEMMELQNRLSSIRKEMQALRDPGVVGPGLVSIVPNAEEDAARLRKLDEDLIEVIKKMSELRNRGGGGAPITPIVIDENNLQKLDDALTKMREAGKARIDDLWEHFSDRYATAEQKVAEEMRQFDMVDHLFSEEDQNRIRDAIREPLMEGLEEFDLGEIEARQSEFLAGRAKQLRSELDRIKTTAEEIGLTFASAFEDAIVQARSLKDVVRGLLQDIVRIIARKAITEPLANFIGGMFGGGRAEGGPVAAGVPYVVGEKGPEVFVPRASGQIVPNAGGVVVNNYNNIQAGLPPQWEAQLGLAAQISAVAAKESVGKEMAGRR